MKAAYSSEVSAYTYRSILCRIQEDSRENMSFALSGSFFTSTTTLAHHNRHVSCFLDCESFSLQPFKIWITCQYLFSVPLEASGCCFEMCPLPWLQPYAPRALVPRNRNTSHAELCKRSTRFLTYEPSLCKPADCSLHCQGRTLGASSDLCQTPNGPTYRPEIPLSKL
jgi:hypothetical protein